MFHRKKIYKEILPPTGKRRALQFLEMAMVFHYYLGKFGLNVFLDLKSKKIKLKSVLKTKFAHFFVILLKIKFVYTF